MSSFNKSFMVATSCRGGKLYPLRMYDHFSSAKRFVRDCYFSPILNEDVTFYILGFDFCIFDNLVWVFDPYSNKFSRLNDFSNLKGIWFNPESEED